MVYKVCLKLYWDMVWKMVSLGLKYFSFNLEILEAFMMSHKVSFVCVSNLHGRRSKGKEWGKLDV